MFTHLTADRHAPENQKMFSGTKKIYQSLQHSPLKQVNVYLKDREDRDPYAFDGTTPLMIFAYEGNLEMVEKLATDAKVINQRTKDGFTALMFAVWNNHYHAAKKLIKNGAKTDTLSNENKNAMHYAIDNQNARMIYMLDKSVLLTLPNRVSLAIQSRNLDILRFVLENETHLSDLHFKKLHIILTDLLPTTPYLKHVCELFSLIYKKLNNLLIANFWLSLSKEDSNLTYEFIQQKLRQPSPETPNNESPRALTPKQRMFRDPSLHTLKEDPFKVNFTKTPTVVFS